MPAKKAQKKVSSYSGRYLRAFRLQNVRTFRSPVSLDFCHPDGKIAQWTVILGENGIGKTTLLQHIAGLRIVNDSFGQSLTLKDDGLPKIKPQLASPEWLGWCAANIPSQSAKSILMSIEAEISNPQKLLNADHQSSNEEIPLDLKLRFGENDKGMPTINAEYSLHKNTEIYRQLNMFAYGAGRHVAGSASPYLSSDTFDTSPTITIFRDDQPLISPEQWLLGLDHAARSDGASKVKAQNALRSACRCLTSALPDVLDISVKSYGFIKDHAKMSVICKTPYGEIPFGALSVGYRTMAAWLTDFVKRMHDLYPDLNEPDNGPAIVLIDEFDLHMHPKWQREAMSAIGKEFPNTQFIITAHSPIVVQAAGENAKLIVLRRRKCKDGLEEVEVVDNPEYAAGWRLDQILESLYAMTPRMPDFDHLVQRRISLLKKKKVTKSELSELEEIEKTLNNQVSPRETEASKWLHQKLQEALNASTRTAK